MSKINNYKPKDIFKVKTNYWDKFMYIFIDILYYGIPIYFISYIIIFYYLNNI